MSYLVRTKALFAKLQRPLSSRDLEFNLDITQVQACKILAFLVKHECLDHTSGNVRTGKFYMWREGAELPPDRRGSNPNSRSALRRKASKSASKQTKGRHVEG